MATKDSKNILIYRLGSLGDTIMALPSFHKIRESYPDSNITLLTNRPVAAKAAPLESILGNDGYFFNEVLDYPLQTRSPIVLANLIRQIRSRKIHTVINLTPARSKMSAVRDKLFFRIAGAKKLIGFPSDEDDFKLLTDPATGLFEWEAKRLGRRLQVLGDIDLKKDLYWDLRLSAEETNAADSYLKEYAAGTPLLAISSGTKCQSKDWEEPNWLNLIKRLKTQLPDWKLVMIGAPDEAAFAQKCLETWGVNDGINICGKTSPRVSAAILQKTKIFIGHDSGPMHLAASVGIPTVSIFAARNLPAQWYPRGDFNKILYHKTDCAGCGLEVCIEQKKKCILSITVDEVESAILQSLK